MNLASVFWDETIHKQTDMFYVFIYFPFNEWIFQFKDAKFISQDKMQIYNIQILDEKCRL